MACEAVPRSMIQYARAEWTQPSLLLEADCRSTKSRFVSTLLYHGRVGVSNCYTSLGGQSCVQCISFHSCVGQMIVELLTAWTRTRCCSAASVECIAEQTRRRRRTTAAASVGKEEKEDEDDRERAARKDEADQDEASSKWRRVRE